MSKEIKEKRITKEDAWEIVREDIAHKLILEKKKEIERIKKSIKRILELFAQRRDDRYLSNL